MKRLATAVAAPCRCSQVIGRFVWVWTSGGVLLAKLTSGQLPTAQTPNDIGIVMGYAPGAVERLAECVNNYGANNVFVVSFVQSKRKARIVS